VELDSIGILSILDQINNAQQSTLQSKQIPQQVNVRKNHSARGDIAIAWGAAIKTGYILT
jgi:hypothetical protein